MTPYRYIPLDSLKELAGFADQVTPSVVRAFDEIRELQAAGHDVRSLTSFAEQALLLGGAIAAAMRSHEPNAHAAACYGDGRPVMTHVALGDSGSTFIWVWPADPDRQPVPEQVRAGDGRLFDVRTVDGQVVATPTERGSADVGGGV